MSFFDAGVSRARYELQADAALRTQQSLIRGYQQLGRASAIKPPTFGGAAVTAEQVKLAQAIARTAEAQARAALATNRRAESDAKAARAIAQTALIDQKRQTEAARTAAADDRAAQAALRRGQAEARAAQPRAAGGSPAVLPRTFAGFTQAGAGQLAGLAGGAFSVSALVGAGQEALALRETQNGLRAVAGSVTNYERTLKAAREQQELFGGTLRENIEGLTGLTITSRQSGATLETLIDLSQRLAVLDPSQGAAGARIALSEALSGDPTSLAKRYEIPRAALARLRDETTSASEKLLIIDQYLNKVGVSSAAVAGRIDQDALAFRRAAAEIEEATVKLGGYIARVAAVPARGITELLDTGTITGGSDVAGAELQANLITQAASFEDYAQSIRTSNDQISEAFKNDPLGGFVARQRFGLEQLNPVQFAYAQSLIQTGTATDVAIAKARELAEVSDLLTQQTQGQSGAIQALIPTMAQAASGSQENAGQVLALNSAYLQGQISVDVLKLALDGMISVQDAAAQAAFQEERETRQLERSFIDIIPAANAAANAIAGVGIAAGAAAGLPETRRIGGIGNTTGTLADRFGGGAGGVFARVDADQRALQDSRDQLALANAKTNAEKIAIFQRQLDKQTTEEGRNRVLAQIANLRNAGGGGRAGPKPTTGLGVLDQDAIQRGENAQAQLAEVNRLLERTNLTEHQRNDLLEKRRKLEQDITEEIDKQQRAALDAQLGAVQDAQARLKENREAAGLQRALQGGRISETQQEAARLRLAEISLEQQKRALDIQKDQRIAGVEVTQQAQAAQAQAVDTRQPTPITQPLPLPNLAQLPALQAPQQTIVNLTLNIDKAGNATVTQSDPNIVLNLLGQSVSFRNLSGGTP